MESDDDDSEGCDVVRATALLILGVLVAAPMFAAPPAGADPVGVCRIAGGHGAFGGTQGVVVSGQCVAAPVAAVSSPVRTKTIFCGRASRVKGGPETQWDARCGAPQQCYLDDPATGQPTLTDAFATITLVNGRWSDPVVWCPANAVPALPMAA